VIELSKKTNVLEQDPYKFSLQDVATPNLYRDLYPYDEIPRVPFNHRRVPMSMPAEIWLTDTTFRDGQQSRAPYSVQQMVDLFDMLHRLGGEKGLIRQTEFFVYSDKDREALHRCMERGYQYPEITTWIRATKGDFQLVKDIGIKETGILVSCSDYHIFKKLNMTRAQAMQHYLEIVSSAIEAGLRPRCHFEDITRADFYGFVVPFANELMDLAQQSGIPVKIRACDTMGYGVPYTGVALPRSVPGIIYGLQTYSDVPSEMLEWHGHNDFYKGVVNASTAWLYGASAVNCSLLGIGERTGNVPLEAMVVEYASLRGSTDGMDTTVITEIAEYFEREIGHDIHPMTPFVGKSFNVTRAGIHADGLLKDEEIYNIFDTGKLLNRPASVSVSNVSGLAGIAYWLNDYFGLQGADRVDKKDEIASLIKAWVDREYTTGRQTVISDEELVGLARAYDPAKYSRQRVRA
jgi:citrate (Re)-synthase